MFISKQRLITLRRPREKIPMPQATTLTPPMHKARMRRFALAVLPLLLFSMMLGTGASVLTSGPITAGAEYGYPTWTCPSGTPERYTGTTETVADRRHVSFYIPADDGGLRAVRVHWTGRSLICDWHAYLWLHPEVNLSSLHSDETLYMTVYWRGSDGVEHTTKYSSFQFKPSDVTCNGFTPCYYSDGDDVALYDLGSTEHFVKVRVRMQIEKDTGAGIAVSTVKNVTARLRSKAYFRTHGPDTTNASAPFPDGTFLKEASSDLISVMYAGALFPVEVDEYAAFGYDSSKLQTVADGTLGSIPDAPPDGTLMREKSSSDVYVIQSGAKLLVSPYEFTALGYSSSNVIVVPDGLLSKLSDVPDDGSLLQERSGATIYGFHTDDSLGAMKYALTPDAFTKLGYSASDVRIVPNGSLQTIPDGNLADYILANDITPPTTTASLSPQPNAAGWNTATSVTLAAVDGGGDAGVQSITYSADGAQTIAQVTVTSSSASVPLTTDGTTTLHYFATDKAGNVEASKDLTVKVDGTKPLASTPTVSLYVDTPQLWSQINTTITPNTVPVKIAWSGSDTTSGVAQYQLLERDLVNGVWGSWWVHETMSSTNTIIPLAMNRTYQFAIQVQDTAGNWSDMSSPVQYSVVPAQIYSSAISYSPGWQTATDSAAWSGATKYSSLNTATATLTFTGTQVAWVAPKYTNRGKATVSIDGGSAQIVDLYQNATSVQNRRVVFVAKDLAPGTTHTLKVYVAGTKNSSSTDTRVDIDGFVILK